MELTSEPLAILRRAMAERIGVHVGLARSTGQG
jgi:hypothetical protein